MHALAAAMHRNNIAPAGMKISLPRDEWWKLWCALERKFRGIMPYDGRTSGTAMEKFQYMGFTFVSDDEPTLGDRADKEG